MRAVLLALVLLAGCSGCGECRSSDGLWFYDMPYGTVEAWDCVSFIYAAEVARKELYLTNDPRMRETRLDGWRLRVYNAKSWTYAGKDHYVSGLSNCDGSVMVVNKEPPLQSSLAHEMAHALQNCDPKSDQEEGEDYSHAGWHSRGIYDAIERVKATKASE